MCSVLQKFNILILVFLLSVATVFAANDSFSVSLVLDPDSTPPTTPTITSAVPVASSQIDLTWSTSTDNVLMGGYQVFRNATQIATTTLLSYSDSGLVPSTLYTYTVRAFDNVYNFSTTSIAIATTTLSSPVATSSTSSSGGVDVELISFDSIPGIRSMEISWVTNRYAKYSLRWGRTMNYELGFLSTDIFSREHNTLINELEPDTIYEYELIAYDRRGEGYIMSRGQFSTLEDVDIVAPPNVSNLRANAVGDDVLLEWNNPIADDFSHVRVLRSHLFFPSDPYDGYIVYQGDKESILDTQAFQVSPGQYYSVFTYDKSGNISSGAVVYVLKSGEVINVPNFPQKTASSSAGTTSAALDLEINFSDFRVIQDGVVLDLHNNQKIFIDGSKPITVSVPYDLLPEHLKTITVTFTHPEDSNLTFSFLLRVNKDKTAYEAVIAPFYESGEFVMSVSVFDFKTNILKKLEGSLNSSYFIPTVESTYFTAWMKLLYFITISIGILWLLILLLKILNNQRDGWGTA